MTAKGTRVWKRHSSMSSWPDLQGGWLWEVGDQRCRQSWVAWALGLTPLEQGLAFAGISHAPFKACTTRLQPHIAIMRTISRLPDSWCSDISDLKAGRSASSWSRVCSLCLSAPAALPWAQILSRSSLSEPWCWQSGAELRMTGASFSFLHSTTCFKGQSSKGFGDNKPSLPE